MKLELKPAFLFPPPSPDGSLKGLFIMSLALILKKEGAISPAKLREKAPLSGERTESMVCEKRSRQRGLEMSASWEILDI